MRFTPYDQCSCRSLKQRFVACITRPRCTLTCQLSPPFDTRLSFKLRVYTSVRSASDRTSFP